MISAVALPGPGGEVAEATLASLAFAAEILVPDPAACESARAIAGPRVRSGHVEDAACDWLLLIRSGEVAPAGLEHDLDTLAEALYETAEIRVGGKGSALRLAKRGVPLDGDEFAAAAPTCPAFMLCGLSVVEARS